MGNSLEVLKTIPDNSVDSIVTDPPYGISFMGKKWDYQVPSREIFSEILRVLKPGGHMLCACGTRTQHRMAVNIEDAGFEIRDVVTWLYGSGFPKSMDISKAIDKQRGYIRSKEKCGKLGSQSSFADDKWTQESSGMRIVDEPICDEVKQWQGFGTALKPACEFWTLARKPISEKTIASNVLKHGTGGINIDGCRIEAVDLESLQKNWNRTQSKSAKGGGNSMSGGFMAIDLSNRRPNGRFPANLILDEEAAAELDEQSGILKSGKFNQASKKAENSIYGKHESYKNPKQFEASQGGASRFFYVAKASKSDRGQGNIHPTVKPIKLMQYLCRMITPMNGIVLDPFMGSGSTGVAAVKEGFGFIGVELNEDYFRIAKTRIEG